MTDIEYQSGERKRYLSIRSPLNLPSSVGAVTPEAVHVADLVRALFGDSGRPDPRVSLIEDGGNRYVKVHNAELNVLKGVTGLRRRRLESAFYAKLDKALKAYDITAAEKGTYCYRQPSKSYLRRRPK